MNVRIDEASGIALDYLFAKALSVKDTKVRYELCRNDGFYSVKSSGFGDVEIDQRTPSTVKKVIDALEKHGIGVIPEAASEENGFNKQFLSGSNLKDMVKGSSFVEAGMRAYALKMLGKTYSINNSDYKKLYNKNPDLPIYHVTTMNAFDCIMSLERIMPGSYWTSSLEMAKYYMRQIEDHDPDETAMLITSNLKALQPDSIQPDMSAIEDPATIELGKSANDIATQWKDSKGTWKDSLDIVGSIKYSGSIRTIDIELIPNVDFREENKPKKTIKF